MCCWRYHYSPQNLQVRLVFFHHSIKTVLLMAKSLDHWFSGIIRIGQHCSAVCMVPVVFTSSLKREKVVQIAKYWSMVKSPFWNAPWQNPPWDIAWTSYHQSCVVSSEISQNNTLLPRYVGSVSSVALSNQRHLVVRFKFVLVFGHKL